MRHTKTILIAALLATAVMSQGQKTDSSARQDNTRQDNTEVNKRDRNAGEVTADQQKMNAADEGLTKKIRQSIMSDKSLSTNAHNVKIVSQDGSVTLKGPVKSEDEKKTVMGKAVAAAGSADKVTDELSVAP
ncbi:MAG: BON domain-containing protein [Bryobacteraceae bacterium]